MSETEQEAAEEQTEAAETTASDQSTEDPSEGDQPDIEPDEQADIGGLADLAEQVEEDAGADTAANDETSADDPAPTDQDTMAASPNDSWGDLYVGTVTTGLNAVIDEFGDDDASHIDESLARDLNLDVYVDKWMAENEVEEMDPGKGMLISTATLCLIVLVSKTDLPQQALSQVQNHD